jgi:uncharacterized protein YbjT (DUF2867 family)
MARTVLITGATGLVSSSLLAALEPSSSLKLRALVRDPNKADALRQRGVELVTGDLDEPESLPAAFAQVTDLWLLNAVSPRQPENSLNALWAAKHAGVERVVRMSAIGAAHDAPSRNGRLHVLSDDALMASSFKWTILRPHFFMQNLLMSAAAVANEGALHLAMGQGKLGMIDARDIGAMAARILTTRPDEHHGKIYTPTGPASLSLEEVAAQIAQAIDQPVRYVPVPVEGARQGMLQAGLSPWLVGLLAEYFTAYSRDWGNFTTSHVSDVLGRPARSVLDFARDHARAFHSAA